MISWRTWNFPKFKSSQRCRLLLLSHKQNPGPGSSRHPSLPSLPAPPMCCKQLAASSKLQTARKARTCPANTLAKLAQVAPFSVVVPTAYYGPRQQVPASCFNASTNYIITSDHQSHDQSHKACCCNKQCYNTSRQLQVTRQSTTLSTALNRYCDGFNCSGWDDVTYVTVAAVNSGQQGTVHYVVSHQSCHDQLNQLCI